MKKILFVMLFAVMAFAVSAQVKFEDNPTLKQLIAKAEAAKKPIFIDIYATWCGPCKYMANTIFPQKSVGDYLNATFVNAKIDGEKGEGPELMKRFGVRAYPTFLLLDSSGKEIGRMVGGSEADEFIKKIKGLMK